VDRQKRRPGGGGVVSFVSFDRCENTATRALGQPRRFSGSFGTHPNAGAILSDLYRLCADRRARFERKRQALANGRHDIDFQDLRTIRRELQRITEAERFLDGVADALVTEAPGAR